MTEPVSVTEVERKLTVPEAFTIDDVLEALSTIGEITVERRRILNAVYYDTDDFRLARSRVTLRRRTGGNDSGWHLKLPPLDLLSDAREEQVLPLSAGRPRPVAAPLGQAVVESERLDGEARRIERIALGLRTSAGIPLALLDAGALERAQRLAAEGLARITADRLQLVHHGRALVDPIVADLI